MGKYTFDVKMFATVQVNAPDEATARTMINAAIDGTEANLGAWPDGSPILAGIGLDGEHDLIDEDDAEERAAAARCQRSTFPRPCRLYDGHAGACELEARS